METSAVKNKRKKKISGVKKEIMWSNEFIRDVIWKITHMYTYTHAHRELSQAKKRRKCVHYRILPCYSF